MPLFIDFSNRLLTLKQYFNEENLHTDEIDRLWVAPPLITIWIYFKERPTTESGKIWCNRQNIDIVGGNFWVIYKWIPLGLRLLGTLTLTVSPSDSVTISIIINYDVACLYFLGYSKWENHFLENLGVGNVGSFFCDVLARVGIGAVSTVCCWENSLCPMPSLGELGPLIPSGKERQHLIATRRINSLEEVIFVVDWKGHHGIRRHILS